MIRTMVVISIYYTYASLRFSNTNIHLCLKLYILNIIHNFKTLAIKKAFNVK